MFIGIDLGTSSVKTILIDINQNTLATKTESISIENPQNGYYEQNPEEWYEATIRCFDYLKKQMPTIKEAIIKTGAQRLRPVLLTTFTTVLGLLPMVTMTNVDFFTRQIKVGTQDTQWWVQLSTAIVFGLIFATLLTLIVTPSALMLKENVVNWYRKKINV